MSLLPSLADAWTINIPSFVWSLTSISEFVVLRNRGVTVSLEVILT